jgi:hypothetical protein
MTRLPKIFLMTLTTLLVASVAPALAADTAVNDAYSSPVNDAYGNAGSSLPFSGLDLGLIAAGGLVLVALGFGLRRATRTQ